MPAYTFECTVGREEADKRAEEAFAKVWNSEEAIAEREKILNGLDELVRESEQEHAIQQDYLDRISEALDKGDIEEADRLMEEFINMY